MNNNFLLNHSGNLNFKEKLLAFSLLVHSQQQEQRMPVKIPDCQGTSLYVTLKIYIRREGLHYFAHCTVLYMVLNINIYCFICGHTNEMYYMLPSLDIPHMRQG